MTFIEWYLNIWECSSVEELVDNPEYIEYIKEVENDNFVFSYGGNIEDLKECASLKKGDVVYCRNGVYEK